MRHIPTDLANHYSVKRLCFSLKTKSLGYAIRASKSVSQRLEDYWFGIRFKRTDAPALPVHDSFIMHHANGGELEEAMRRAFYERFNSDIPIKEEILEALPALPYEEEPDNLSVEEILKGEVEYSQWQDRDRMWWDRKR